MSYNISYYAITPVRIKQIWSHCNGTCLMWRPFNFERRKWTLLWHTWSSLLDSILKQKRCPTGRLPGVTCKYNYECCKGWSCIERTAERKPQCKSSNAVKCCKGSSWIGHLFGSSPSRLFSDRLFDSSPYHIFIDHLLGSILSHLMYVIAKFTHPWQSSSWTPLLF
jgi:hypothetical protein